MKSFRKIVTEVAQPKGEDEINFKAKHEIELIDEPNAEESQFEGGTKKTKPRKADYVDGEDEAVYESTDEENLYEAAAFASGTVKFGDGKTGNVKEQDASILNTLYAKLKKEGAGSHEEMHKHAMENQKNFAAVVEFAIETVGK